MKHSPTATVSLAVTFVAPSCGLSKAPPSPFADEFVIYEADGQ